MKVAVVGATGLVGRTMLKILEEKAFPVSQLIPVASERSAGKTIRFNGKKTEIITLEDALKLRPSIALFSAGAQVSINWAPEFTALGTKVIDNSSAWRMDPKIKLVVPEINAHCLTKRDMIIANPNCTTIQLTMALAPLHQRFKLKRVIVATYQSVTGTGMKAVKQLDAERRNHFTGEEDGSERITRTYPYPIDLNCLPHCDVFLKNGFSKEEMKVVNETRKILGSKRIRVCATAVRVPVKGAHSEAVNAEFRKPFELTEVRTILSSLSGVRLVDDPSKNIYPMPLFAEGKDEVFVGRIRRDETVPNGLCLWIVADNLRKGAATNAVQIAQYLIDKKWL